MAIARRERLLIHPRATYTETQARKIAKRRDRDGYGTRHPFPGLFVSSGCAYHQPGQLTRYNGGCVHGGEWYPGEYTPFPQIPDGFRFIARDSWGIYLEEVKP
jgi:hypothetical protein